jgi:hypothetical protein
MKKMFRLSYAVLLLTSLLTACTIKDPQPISSKYGKGVLVVNEGNFSDANGSLSFIKENNEVVNDVFQAENSVALGGIVQFVKGYNLSNSNTIADKLAIITNSIDQVVFTEATDFKVVGVLDANGSAKQVENPQAFATLGNKGYVTNWGDINKAFGATPEGFITEIDLQTRAFLRKIPTNSRPQGIVTANNKLYVANSNTNTISVYNSNGNLTQTIIVANKPDKFLIDVNNKIWVICLASSNNTKGSLVQINPFTDKTELSILDVPTSTFNAKIAIYNNNIYSVSGSKIFSIDITTQTILEFISNDFSIYGFSINPQNGELYLGEGSFSNASRIRRISLEGKLIKEYLGGIGTNGFLFYR